MPYPGCACPQYFLQMSMHNMQEVIERATIAIASSGTTTPSAISSCLILFAHSVLHDKLLYAHSLSGPVEVELNIF